MGDKQRKESSKKRSFGLLSIYLGFLGILLIILGEITTFLRIEPFVYWFIAMVWFGYIFLVDSLVYMLEGNSYITNRPRKFIILVFLSAIFWLIFEFYNKFLGGWYYIGTPTEPGKCIPCYVAISTILPAVMETTELIKGLRFFRKTRTTKIRISNSLIYSSILIGLIFVITPFLYHSPYMWAFVWIGFIFLLDPINYLFHERSLISQIKKGKLNIVLSLFVAGYICGFFWEFWNYWAYTKWYYTVPILSEIKIFEIPFLGFFAYGFFAWELYTMYHFAKLLIPTDLETKLELK
ncbi:MAG: hypothetical protein QMD36_01800 [Candidatus Aenigmarchaeota archaeon]|nr:hypothetical protein [Candidatus Aenigmarchaeota archaeon]